MTPRTLTLEAWRAEGRARFGHDDARLWIFVCPSCGQEQRYKDLRDLGVPHPERYMGYACIGRFNLNRPERADSVVNLGQPTVGFGCMYYPVNPRASVSPVLLQTGGPTELRPTFAFAP